MGQDPKLTLILLLVAIAVLLQAAALVGVLRSILKMQREVEGIRSDVKQRLDPIAESVGRILADAREPVRAMLVSFAEISRGVEERGAEVSRAVQDLVDRGRLQIIRIDQLISGLVQKIESSAEVVQREIVGPIQEASAVIRGLRAGLGFLFSRRSTSATSEVTQDEQMFI